MSELRQLPDGWAWERLGDYAEFVNGRAYSQDELLDQGTPVIRIQNLNGGERWYYSDLDLPSEKYCESGDLLFAWSATFGPYVWYGERAIFHYHIWKVLPRQGLDRAFAYHLLQRITAQLKSSAHGVAMLHITKAGMENWRIALPPYNVQQRIAARIEAHMAEIAAARAAAEAELAAAEELAAAYLRVVFESDEAQGWEQIPLRAICRDDGQYGLSLKSSSKPEGVPILGMSNIRDGRIVWGNLKYIILEDDDLNKYRLEPGDVIFNRTNSAELVGKTAVFDTQRDAVFASYLVRFQLIEEQADPGLTHEKKLRQQYLKQEIIIPSGTMAFAFERAFSRMLLDQIERDAPQ